jgi:lipopolysaccharide/colanic/teichoic acid biosynthesis glycosyltransferase
VNGRRVRWPAALETTESTDEERALVMGLTAKVERTGHAGAVDSERLVVSSVEGLSALEKTQKVANSGTRIYFLPSGRALTPASRRRRGRTLKRALDVAVSVPALVLGAPILAAAAIAIKRDSPGPVFFVQNRIGLDGRVFRILKLRTMFIDNDDSAHAAYVESLITGEARRWEGGLYKITDDPRITRVGRILRKLSIDELPQLFNVLRGDMSVVGPRPALPREVALYDDTAMQRLAVKPGVTGLWQVSGRNELSFHEMVALDIAYAQTWSVGRDLQILVRTPAAVLAKKGAA